MNTNMQPTIINVVLVPDVNNVDHIPVNPGTSVMFLNEKMTEFKMRSRDPNGFPGQERTWTLKETTPPSAKSGVVTREEMDAMNSKMDQILAMLTEFAK
jgi:hypothetical protein